MNNAPSFPRLLKTAAAAALLGLSAASHAALVIDAGAGSNQQTFSTGDYVAGTEFTITSSMTIDGLGWLDAEGNGLTHSHEMGLWNSAGTLIATTTVTNGNTFIGSAQGTARWYISEIAEILLAPGSYRIAGSMNGDNIALSNDKIGNGASLSAGYVRTDFPNGGFAYPNLTFDSQAIRATVVSNQFDDVGRVPEPASIILLGSALGLLAASRRRKQ